MILQNSFCPYNKKKKITNVITVSVVVQQLIVREHFNVPQKILQSYRFEAG